MGGCEGTDWCGQWSMVTEPKLFTPAGTHIYEEDEFKEDEEIDVEKVS